MYPISAAYTAALRYGYRIVARADIIKAGQVIASAPLADGSVTEDRTAATRRRATATIVVDPLDPLIPALATDPLAPFGNELALYFGFLPPSGPAEYVPCGVFPLVTVDTTDTGTDLAISATLYDRSWTVAARKLKYPYVIANGTDLMGAVQTLINSVYPGLTYNLTPTGTVVSGGITVPNGTNFSEGDDPWAAALTLADAGGYELFFDRHGVLVGRPIPNPASQTAVWTYDDTQGAGPTGISHRWTRDGIPNDFIVSGTGTGIATPVRAESSVTSSTDPMWTGGAYGDVPTFTTSSMVSTTGQASAASGNQLTVARGMVEQLTLSVVPIPCLDVDDVLAVSRSRMRLSGNWVADAITTTLRHDGTGSITARRT